MTDLSNKYTHKAICSVCFRDHFLNPAHGGQKPIRHGFHVIGGGHVGAWHTGPCFGTTFPHFGVSTEGTKWALGEILNAILHAKAHVAGLEARPALSWSFQPKKYQAATWQNRKSSYVPDGPAIERVLVPGTEPERIAYRQEGITYDQHVNAPSYEQELNRRLIDAKAHLKSLEADRAKYEHAIATWKPVEPVPTKTDKPVHLGHRRESMPNLMFADCNSRIKSYSANPPNITLDKTKVTCQRCKKSC